MNNQIAPCVSAWPIAMLLCFLFPVTHAGPIETLIESGDESAWNGFIGGTVSCESFGTYDSSTNFFSMSGPCLPLGEDETGTGLVIGSSEDLASGQASVGGISTEASLTGFVDNSGNVQAGTFSLFGVSPDFGINDFSLLATGRLVDVCYCVNSVGFGWMQALIELDFLVDEFAGLGSMLLWSVNGGPTAQWGSPITSDLAWQVSVDESDWSQFSGSQYFFYDKAVFVAEPNTSVLLLIGLLLLFVLLRGRSIDGQGSFAGLD